MPELRIFDSVSDFDHAAAELFVAAADEAIRLRGRFLVALSGGSTPRSMYALLAAEQASHRSRIAWQNVQVFWGDERHVGPEDPQSNYRMTREALLDQVPIPPENIHRVRAENPDAAAAAADYEADIRRVFELAAGGFPTFDLVLLGMGPDAHTASLFPGTDVIHESVKLVAAPWVEKFKSFRITLTPPVLNGARQVTFMIRGEDKAEALQAVRRSLFDPDRYPAQIIRPAQGKLTWLLDRAAARLID
ncbi:MAG: 6-phosphogluconolactonase [Pirellulales bacterium]|nr:6-phosphogluconolactonase [Pirellulales bacterium]